MARKVPPPISIFKAVYICMLAVARPDALAAMEAKYVAEIEKAPADTESRVKKVHKAFWKSFGLIVAFGTVGVLSGLLLKCQIGDPSATAMNTLQVIGAGLLLWGTLFVRGFEIQTYSEATLSERVNQWLYRALYCVGTAVIISSLAWASN